MPSLKNVELARPGTHHLSTGTTTFSRQDLVDAAAFANLPGQRPVPVKLGHIDDRFDGEPAMGWVENIRLDGDVLVGDINDMPGWLHASVRSAYPDRSIEAWQNLDVEGKSFGLALKGLALLGCTEPGIPSLRSLRELPAAIAASTASAQTITFDVEAAKIPAPDPGSGNPKGVGVAYTPAQRLGLGLAEDASDIEVDAKLVSLGLVLASTSAEKTDSVVVTAPAAPGVSAPAPTVSAPAAAPGTEQPVVSASAENALAEEVKRLSSELAEIKASKATEKRDAVIMAAVGSGKIAPADKARWEQNYDEAPAVTERVLESIAAGAAVPVHEVGHGKASDAQTSDEVLYASLGFSDSKVSA